MKTIVFSLLFHCSATGSPSTNDLPINAHAKVLTLLSVFNDFLQKVVVSLDVFVKSTKNATESGTLNGIMQILIKNTS